jgi:hypothetical protein
MNNNQKKELCLALMRADSEAEVVRVLTEVGNTRYPHQSFHAGG